MDLLVPRSKAKVARRVLDSFDWQFELGGMGMWRAIPKVSYLWNDLVGIDLLWGVPSAPLAVRHARRLEQHLWRRSEPTEAGARLADPDDLIVYAAVQTSRPGRPQRYDGEDLAAFIEGRGGVGGALAVADGLGLGASTRRGLHVAGVNSDRSAPRTVGWRLADVAWRRLRPRRFRGLLLTGSARLGRAITRSRFAGGEFTSGYGVFLPRAISEPLVATTLAAIEGVDRPVVLDIGTGCGAVALAVADAVPGTEVHAVDTSRRALWWARWNRPFRRILKVRFHRGSLLEPLPRRLHGRAHAMAANVPYVPATLWGEGWTSSRGTVVGAGDDGLGLYRTLMRGARAFLRPGGRIVFQIGRDQWRHFGGELEELGYELGEEVSGGPGDLVAWVTWPGGQRRATPR